MTGAWSKEWSRIESFNSSRDALGISRLWRGGTITSCRLIGSIGRTYGLEGKDTRHPISGVDSNNGVVLVVDEVVLGMRFAVPDRDRAAVRVDAPRQRITVPAEGAEEDYNSRIKWIWHWGVSKVEPAEAVRTGAC
jgi:hypothetical protein